jgi:hypothetical protein
MVIYFNTFTRYFFYLFICYHYAKYHYPEKTQEAVIFVCYNSIYLYSKLQILVNKQIIDLHNLLIKYEEYKKVLLFLHKTKDNFDLLKERVLSYTASSEQIHKSNGVTLDFILNNEVIFTFEKSEFLNDYLTDFFPKENESKENDIIDYDFVIVNSYENLKNIIKHVDLIKSDFEAETSSIFKTEPFLYKPLLCEFSNQNDDAVAVHDKTDDTEANPNKPIKIDFCDNNKFYDFLVVGNCFDKSFLTYFMKRYYDIDIKENYVLKIIDNNVNTLIIESTDTLTIGENSLVVNYKK